jgi:peptidyl-prolyl cis-trans isomerase B (cyclophilin B)
MKRLMMFVMVMVFGLAGFAAAQDDASKKDSGEAEMGNPVVVIKTSMGEITVELNQKAAPKTVANFLQYAKDGHYDGTIFHRVIKGFMVQGGGFTSDMAQKTVRDPIKNEADNGLSNRIGTIAMARTNIVDSATAQFFINTVNNNNLDFKSADARGYGYCVFGKVTEGMDVVQAIEGVPTANKGRLQNVPSQTVMIESVTVK